MSSALFCWECGDAHSLERPLPRSGLCGRCQDIERREREDEQDDGDEP